MRNIVFLSLALLFVITGCSETPRTFPTSTAVKIEIPFEPTVTLEKIEPTLTSSVTPSAVPASTPTTSSYPITGTLKNFQVITRCLEIVQEHPTDIQVSGTVVYQFRGKETGFDNYLLNLETGSKISLNVHNGVLHWYTVSADRYYLAYEFSARSSYGETPSFDELVIVTADGEKIVQIPWEEDWVRLYRWLDNERLLIALEGDQPRSLLLLNPFTGERQTILPDYPELYPYPFAEWDDSSAMSPDPSLTRVVYPRIGEIALWDIPNSQTLVTLHRTNIIEVPRWTVDGERFVIAAYFRDEPAGPRYELYQVTRDGEVTQLTELEATYPNFDLAHYDWSPDGRYIAFWLIPEIRNYTEQYLAVLDVETQTMINYCLPNFALEMDPGPPIWSPDSRQVIVEVQDPDDEGHILVVLVDGIEHHAVQIEEDMAPVGWLRNP